MRILSVFPLLLVVFGCAARTSYDHQRPAADHLHLYPLAHLTLDADAQVSVLNARKVNPKLYAASFYSRDLTCTSSLVGPRTLLTAAHCIVPDETIVVHVSGRALSAVCTQAPAYRRDDNTSADYALCLIADEIRETPYFESINIDPELLSIGQEVLLTGFGCTRSGGGGDASGTVYRVGEAKITKLPAASNNLVTTKGGAALCFGDSGGPAFLQRGTDGGPRIQISVNATGNIRDVSGLASLSTAVAVSFLYEWSRRHEVTICGIHADASNCKDY